MANCSPISKDELTSGVIHEIGHVLAALLCFPNKDIVTGFEFRRKNQIGCGFYTTTNPNSIKFNKEQINLYAIFCLAGGVFQQMTAFNQLLQANYCKFNEVESNIVDKDEALIHFFSRYVKVDFDGMEEDNNRLDIAISAIKKTGNAVRGNKDDYKIEAITLLLPYLSNKNVHKLVTTCVATLQEKIGKREIPVLFTMDFISSFLLNEVGSIIEA